MRKRGLILLPLAAFVTGLSVSLAYGRVADHNPVEVTDPAGDSNGAPDITGVTVANDLAGVILFVVEVGNRDGLVANDEVRLFIDSDRNAQTGMPLGEGGVDYIIVFDGTAKSIAIGRWNGTEFQDYPSTSLQGAWRPGYVAAIDRTELGNTAAFEFVTVTELHDGPANAFDIAPTGVYQLYTVAPPHIESIAARFSTPAPRAGTTFRLNGVQLTFETEESAAAATFTCRATLAGKRIRGTGPGGCTFKLPKTAKGKRFVVTITAAPAGGKAQAFPAYTFRVR